MHKLLHNVSQTYSVKPCIHQTLLQMTQIKIIHQKKIQQKVILYKEKCFIAFKRLWQSVDNEAHKHSFTTEKHIAIVSYSAGDVPYVYDSSNSFDSIDKFLNDVNICVVKGFSFIILPLEKALSLFFYL